jgi:dynein heavy chain
MVPKYLRVCFRQSPFVETSRIRALRFPSLVNWTIVDWFHTWPDYAPYSVAKNLSSDLDLGGNGPKNHWQIIANVHLSVIKISDEYLESERRYNYDTPKSYLELIPLFKSTLETKFWSHTWKTSLFISTLSE